MKLKNKFNYKKDRKKTLESTGLTPKTCDSGYETKITS